MRVVIQRALNASVSIDQEIYNEIDHGLVVLLGIGTEDTVEDLNWLVSKIVNLRIFSDEFGKMNRAIKDSGGAILLVSQFTLYASTKKGNRPSFIEAAPPSQAIPLYERFIEALSMEGISVKTGVFGADMQVKLINDGPVTIIIDSKIKE